MVTNGMVTEKTYLEHLNHVSPDHLSVSVLATHGDPMTVLKDLNGHLRRAGDVSEVWLVVDHDGADRSQFLARCRRGIGRIAAHGVVSVPCFEVWLNAHYGKLQRYQDRSDAQRHYRTLAGLDGGQAKAIPEAFPWDQIQRAGDTCATAPAVLPSLDSQGPSPSTTMPYLVARLGLAQLPDGGNGSRGERS